jgi:hypothetical protein
MIDQQQVQNLLDVLEQSHKPVVIFPETTDMDLLVASWVFREFLEFFLPSQNHQALLLSPVSPQLPKTLKPLLDAEKVLQHLQADSLIIEFPYQTEKIDQVFSQLSADKNHFFITVKPQAGQQPLSEDEVTFRQGSDQADAVFLFGVNDVNTLTSLGLQVESFFRSEKRPVVTFNQFLPDFGSLNIDIAAESYSEMLFHLMKRLLVVASGERELVEFFEGNETKTQHLQTQSATSSTFLAVAELMQYGGKRFLLTPKRVSTNSRKTIKN